MVTSGHLGRTRQEWFYALAWTPPWTSARLRTILASGQLQYAASDGLPTRWGRSRARLGTTRRAAHQRWASEPAARCSNARAGRGARRAFVLALLARGGLSRHSDRQPVELRLRDVLVASHHMLLPAHQGLRAGQPRS